jgi:hypothetical protein
LLQQGVYNMHNRSVSGSHDARKQQLAQPTTKDQHGLAAGAHVSQFRALVGCEACWFFAQSEYGSVILGDNASYLYETLIGAVQPVFQHHAYSKLHKRLDVARLI